VKSYNGFTAKQRMDAFNWLKGEYAAGRRAKATSCDCCGQDKGIVEHHSEDYSAPYGDHIGQYSLCFVCHMMVHCRFRNMRQWEAYKKLVVSGANFNPYYQRNFNGFVAEFLNGPITPVSYEDGERLDVLGLIA
jgi:hypothetical protein